MTATPPYRALYSGMLQTLLIVLGNDELRVVMALVSYADRRGVCWPGVRELARVCVLPIRHVYAALEKLEGLGLIICMRRDVHDPMTGLQLPNIYALHHFLLKTMEAPPNVVFPPLANITQIAGSNSREEWIHNQNQEPESRTRIKEGESSTTITNQSPPLTRTDNDALDGETRSPEQDAGQEQDASAAKFISAADSAANPPSAAAREPKDLAPYANAFTNPDLEQAAADLHREIPALTRAAARMLIDVYTESAVRNALKIYRLQPRQSIKSPAGYIRNLLRQGIAGDDPSPYAEWIEH